MYYPADDSPPQPRFLDDDGGTPVSIGVDRSGNGEEEEEEEEEEDDTQGEDGDTTTPGGTAVNTSTHGATPLLIIQAAPNLDSLYGLREIGREALCWRLSSAKPGNGVEQIRDHSTETYWQSDGTSQPHWIQVHFARRVAISHVCLYLDYNLDESYTPRRLSVQVGMTNQDLVPAIGTRHNPPSSIGPPTLVEFQEPVGWCIVPLSAPPDPLEDDEDQEEDSDEEEEDDEDDPLQLHKRNKRVVKAHLVQISILSQHQNGRDTHIRQVQLYGPRTNSTAAMMKMHYDSMAMDETLANNTARHNNQASNNSDDPQQHNYHAASSLMLQKGRHWDEEFSTVAMSQYSTIR